jgi:hypothetical protein
LTLNRGPAASVAMKTEKGWCPTNAYWGAGVYVDRDAQALNHFDVAGKSADRGLANTTSSLVSVLFCPVRGQFLTRRVLILHARLIILGKPTNPLTDLIPMQLCNPLLSQIVEAPIGYGQR